jgi:hypothetical protein
LIRITSIFFYECVFLIEVEVDTEDVCMFLKSFSAESLEAETPPAMRHLLSRSWFLNTVHHEPASGLLREMADSQVGC